MDILNKTRRPLSVPLPGGKKLFLGPGKCGQITAKAVDHPPLQAMIEAGDLEIADLGSQSSTSAHGGQRQKKTAEPGSSGAGGGIRRSGDR